MRSLSIGLALLLAAGAVFAQGFGPGMMGGNTANSVIVCTDQGVFALRSGVLVRYNLGTLQPELNLELFGPMPAQPRDFTDRAATQSYLTELQKRQAPAIMLAADKFLLIVAGDGFAKVNQDTLKADVLTDLRAPEPAAAAEAQPANPPGGAVGGQPNRMVRQQIEPAPGYTLVGNTLYLFRSKEILALNITDGKIITRNAVAKEQLAQQPQINFGGMRGNAPGRGNNADGGDNPGQRGGRGDRSGRGGDRGGRGGNQGGGAAPTP